MCKMPAFLDPAWHALLCPLCSRTGLVFRVQLLFFDSDVLMPMGVVQGDIRGLQSVLVPDGGLSSWYYFSRKPGMGRIGGSPAPCLIWNVDKYFGV
ncbi:hypothetical protein GDO81_004316 [Engystomops pustulosus]|uniref:Uncharacterized protein n=1 Tax=Engystomops pustulosus TaxID=76066 RepID=A0AAV6ZYZ3_ENGPU|nr:hypothetical protein GDO81_004316 [Engystomops pustulosus]